MNGHADILNPCRPVWSYMLFSMLMNCEVLWCFSCKRNHKICSWHVLFVFEGMKQDIRCFQLIRFFFILLSGWFLGTFSMILFSFTCGCKFSHCACVTRARENLVEFGKHLTFWHSNCTQKRTWGEVGSYIWGGVCCNCTHMMFFTFPSF